MVKKVIVCLIALLAFPLCHSSSANNQIVTNRVVKNRRTLNLKKNVFIMPQQAEKSETPFVTVWIHGTRGFKPFDEYVHAAPPTSKLQAIALLDKNYNRFKNMARSIADADPIKYPFEHFYIFGWTGDLSFDVRQKAAETLHQELEILVTLYTQKYGQAPFIRLITHSHGGNVALNLATVEHSHKNWLINEVILLACPVQHKTEKLIADPLFGRIYSLYSTIDTVQVADPQGLYKKIRVPGEKDIFSKRRFPENEKLTQIKLCINNHGVPHTCFTFCRFLCHLPKMINYLNQWEEEQPNTTHEMRELNMLT